MASRVCMRHMLAPGRPHPAWARTLPRRLHQSVAVGCGGLLVQWIDRARQVLEREQPVVRAADLAFTPERFSTLGLQGLPALKPLADTRLRTHLNVIWHRHHTLSRAAERLKEFVVQRFA